MSATFDKSQTKQTRRYAPGVFIIAVALLLALGAFLWLARIPILRAAANSWIVSDSMTAADAVAIFGGGIEVRPFAAADYFHHNLVKKVVISNVRASRAESLGVLQSHTATNRSVLLKLGVPEGAIEIFGDGLRNTNEEALALRAWAERNAIHAVIVPTEIFSSRRVHWMLHRIFQDSNIRVQVLALEPEGYTAADWWTHEQGLLQFQNEVLKYFYYRWKY